uniref:Uncharacterized protein n=1 Tax=Magallana gigas TaxID=29159 RepID=K1QTR7_MAGGI
MDNIKREKLFVHVKSKQTDGVSFVDSGVARPETKCMLKMAGVVGAAMSPPVGLWRNLLGAQGAKAPEAHGF